MEQIIIDRRAKGFRDFEGIIAAGIVNAMSYKRMIEKLPIKGQELFDTIFAVNPATGLPQGDLAVFMNENTSPEVRQYITQNLMIDNSAGVLPSVKSADFDSIPDDVIVELSRRDGESLSSYRNRMFEYIGSQSRSNSQSDGEE